MKITSLATDGTLQYYTGSGWATVSINQVISAADISAGKLRFVPDSNENGSPYATVGFEVSDGTGFSTSAYSLVVNVTAVNDAPIVRFDAFVVAQRGSIVLGVLDNDFDADSSLLSITHVDGQLIFDGGPAVGVAGGTVTLADGKLIFTPVAGFSGAVTFTYTVTDGSASVSGAINGNVMASVANDQGTLGPSEAPDTSDTVPNRPFQPTLGELQIDGMVLDAVNCAASLGGLWSNIGEHGIVCDTVRAISPLGTTSEVGRGVLDEALRLEPSRLLDLWNRAGFSVESADRATAPWSPQGLTGFSLRMSIADAGLEGSSRSQIIVESLVRDRTLILQISNTLASPNRSVVEYRVQQSNGAPLPGWLDRIGPDLLLGQRPVDLEEISLRITVLYSDGGLETKNVRVDTASGEITQSLQQRRASLALPFTQQFAAVAETINDEALDDLAHAIMGGAAGRRW